MLGDDGFLELVRFFWIFVVPNFAMLLALRSIDVFAYRRLRIVEGVVKPLAVELLIVASFHLGLSVLEALHFYIDPAFLMYPVLLVPVFTVAVLILTYYFDRKRTKGADEVRDFLKGSFKSDLVISLSYDVLYGVFFYRYFIMELSWEKSESVKSDGILIAAVIVLMVIGTLCKILNSRRRIGNVKSDLKEE
jgi:hypothetical protein